MIWYDINKDLHSVIREKRKRVTLGEKRCSYFIMLHAFYKIHEMFIKYFAEKTRFFISHYLAMVLELYIAALTAATVRSTCESSKTKIAPKMNSFCVANSKMQLKKTNTSVIMETDVLVQ